MPFLQIIVWILLAAALCWLANWAFPANVPRPLIYIGIAVAILVGGGYFSGYFGGGGGHAGFFH